jgi:DNA-binding response OmpR family regulator
MNRTTHDPPRVLVAEDDPDMRALVAEALRRDGYVVETAADGGRMLVALARQWIDARGAHLVDLVVSDLRMPICSGLQILEQLRAARWDNPVILMTAFGDDEVRRRALALGALLFDKPFDLHELRAAVASVLRG